MAQDIKSWASKFKSLSDSDPAIASMGKYYTCTYMWDMTDKKVIIEMHDGKICEIHGDEHTGFEIRHGNRQLPTRFKNLEQAEMALEMFKAISATQNWSRTLISSCSFDVK